MKMSEIDKQPPIKREMLSEAHYVESLMREASHLDLISREETDRILLQTIPLLAKQTQRYTKGKSSSVRNETAVSILQSLLYTIGAGLKCLPDPASALNALKETAMEVLFEQGKAVISKDISSAKRLLIAVKANCCVTDNIIYNDTVQKGIDVFFGLYDKEFAAHETPGSIDYPLTADITNLTGIEYICQYLRVLYTENQFCRKLSTAGIDNLFSRYGRGFREMPVNLCEQTVINAVGCELAGKNLLDLSINATDRQTLQRNLENLSVAKLRETLRAAAARVCYKLNITGEMLGNCVADIAVELAPRLKTALENRQLASVFAGINNDEPVRVPF